MTTTTMKRTSLPIETILGRSERETRSIANIRRAGELLGIAREHIDDLINPQDVHIFRLHTNMLGEPMTVWGCSSFHNNARGFYKGGIRISSDVTIWETIELSRLMTLKTALTDLEMGGAKTGINFDVKAMYAHFKKSGYDPEFEQQVKGAIIKAYAHHYRGMLEKRRYVPAPDLGTGPDEMVAIYNETHEPSSVTGKPEGISGWLPGRVEATGYGVSAIIRHLLPKLGKAAAEITIGIQGFGNVGSHTAAFLHQFGFRVVAVVDLEGGVYHPKGLDIPALLPYAREHGSVKGFGTKFTANELYRLPVDVFVPAANNDTVNKDVARRLEARYIVEGANFPVMLEAQPLLEQRGITIVPDIIANAGGVIASAEEFAHSVSTAKISKADILALIETKIGDNLQQALAEADHYHISLDLACTLIAVRRVYQTMRRRGWA